MIKMIIIECDNPFQIKPGKFKSRIHCKFFTRFWWGWFAIAYTDMSLREYSNYLTDGELVWAWKDNND